MYQYRTHGILIQNEDYVIMTMNFEMRPEPKPWNEAFPSLEAIVDHIDNLADRDAANNNFRITSWEGKW